MIAVVLRPLPISCVCSDVWDVSALVSEPPNCETTALISGNSVLSRRDVASSVVSVSDRRFCTPPPLDPVVAGLTKIRLLPSPRTLFVTPACAPCPAAISAITAPTPMMMPSIVSPVRSLFEANSKHRHPQRVDEDHAGASPAARRRRAERVPGNCTTVVRCRRHVGDDPPVAQRDRAARVRRDLRLVRDEDDGDAALAVQPHEQCDDVSRRLRVQRPGRFVREDQRRDP